MNTSVYLRSVWQTKHYAFEFAKIPIPCIADSLAPEDCLEQTNPSDPWHKLGRSGCDRKDDPRELLSYAGRSRLLKPVTSL